MGATKVASLTLKGVKAGAKGARALIKESGETFIDLLGMLKSPSRVESVIGSARKLGLKTGVGTKVYAKLHKPLQSLSNGLKVKRIREDADASKIAVIGRKMPGVVDDTAIHLRKNGAKVETFSDNKAWESFKNHQVAYNTKNKLPIDTYLPHNEVVKTQMYKSNKAWAQKLKDEGYTVIDLDDPLSAVYGSSSDVARSILDSEVKGEGMSSFYSIEKKILFGE